MNPTIQALLDEIKSLNASRTASGANLAEIQKSIEEKQKLLENEIKIEKTARANARALAEIAADNEPDDTGIRLAHIPDAPASRDVHKAGSVQVVDNLAERYSHQEDACRAFFGAGPAFTRSMLTEKSLNAMGQLVVSDKQMRIPEWMSDLIIGKADGNEVISTSKSVSKISEMIAGYRSKTITSTDTTGYNTDSGFGNTRPSGLIVEVGEQPEMFTDLTALAKRVPEQGGIAVQPVIDYSAGNYGGIKTNTLATEITDGTESTLYAKTIKLVCQPHRTLVPVSSYAINRSVVDIVGLITKLLGKSARYKMSQEFLGGTGESTQMARGVIGASGVVVPVRKTVNQMVAADLDACIFGVDPQWREGAIFLIANNGEKYLRSIVVGTADARPLFSTSPATGTYETLGGYRWRPQNFRGLSSGLMADLGTVGDSTFGNWGYYMFAVERDIMITRDDSIGFKNGIVWFKLDVSFSGAPEFPQAFSTLKATTT